jgi:hypothetical protein
MRMKMKYYTVPADVLEDAEELVKWARQATAVALATENAKPAKKPAGESGQRNKSDGKSRQGKKGSPKAGPRKVVLKGGQRKTGSRKVVAKSG